MLNKNIYWNIYSAEEMKVFEKYAQQEDYHWECSESVFIAPDNLIKYIPFSFRLDNVQKTITWEEKIYSSGGRMPGVYIVHPNQKTSYVSFQTEDLNSILQEVNKQVELQVGDFIGIEENEDTLMYPYYHKWFKENNVDFEIACRFAYGQQKIPKGEYKIVAKDFKGIYAIEPVDEVLCPVYLINEESIER